MNIKNIDRNERLTHRLVNPAALFAVVGIWLMEFERAGFGIALIPPIMGQIVFGIGMTLIVIMYFFAFLHMNDFDDAGRPISEEDP